jgi:hypothetical protein
LISREDMIQQSVMDYVRTALIERGYPEDQVELTESFDLAKLRQGLERNVVAAGFNFDDPGEEAELGSDLTRKTYTFEFFVFGLTGTYARNLANVVKFALTRDGRIPLKDISDPAQPVIDYLTEPAARAARQPIPDPEPWQENVWTTTCTVEDEYRAALV